MSGKFQSFLQCMRDFVLRFGIIDETRLLIAEKDKFFAEAKQKFIDENPEHGNLNDYRRAFYKNRVTYKEYMYSYEFWRMNDEQRDRFLSTSEAQCIYRKLGDSKVRSIFSDKPIFLKTYSRFVSRKWIDLSVCNYEEFYNLVVKYDCIVKPRSGTRGQGVFKIKSSEVKDFSELFEQLRDDGAIVEECIRACDELQSFHDASLNTIRVVTISGNGKCEVFGALLRMGVHGSVVDNSHSGGIFAPINISTGKIDIPASDSFNNTYEMHPDSGKSIVGFEIPQWDKIVRTCKQLSEVIPNIRFSGWDLAVLATGDIELIEGNHAPDLDGGLQSPTKTGVKYKFKATVMRTLGLDPLPYISIFKQKRGDD